MTHAQQVDGDKLSEMAKDNKKARTHNYEYSQQKSWKSLSVSVEVYSPNTFSVAFLGHVVYSEGIRVDSEKIDAVKQWPRSTSPTDIRNFLGLADYYKRFVEGFSSISSPLTKLTQKNVKFQWSDE
ncbi:uncharacterized mitochondrial protein AtMg00860-like [Solanum stenotomum]|uniref:uncharacterized mitochondrial protein AtMg00860-like n=1 Tax=Solanum stenotomum TaxID=172797 RepID=UPI0020D08E6A|nr:uncharacterized mitochondrial protein AtMg00860-like [Solanum stenotomum]